MGDPVSSASAAEASAEWKDGGARAFALQGNVSAQAECWEVAERRIQQLIERIQPTKRAEERRNAVSKYVQSLIRKCIDCHVFMFGSVPLKTYLPDGDIDLTAFSRHQNVKDAWANEVKAVLEAEEQKHDAVFRVKEVQYIQAEVKIIKCLVENIVVDVSFNQLGGLCTLCFLEEVDRLIGRNHLFKRSIILVKAWCYYESRILGAHHGLISTYGLETLVLYIFNVFHASLKGPLQVLLKFLEFFSTFDWDNYCVSLRGPVPLASLPKILAQPPAGDGGDLLLHEEFLAECTANYSVNRGLPDAKDRQFAPKFMNVIDPLLDSNNLGRSVSKGNFHRIRSAFAYAAKKLTGILTGPEGSVVEELDSFFRNTWERNKLGLRPDAPKPIPGRQLYSYPTLAQNLHLNGRVPGVANLMVPTSRNSGGMDRREEESGELRRGPALPDRLNGTVPYAGPITWHSTIPSLIPRPPGELNHLGWSPELTSRVLKEAEQQGYDPVLLAQLRSTWEDANGELSLQVGNLDPRVGFAGMRKGEQGGMDQNPMLGVWNGVAAVNSNWESARQGGGQSERQESEKWGTKSSWRHGEGQGPLALPLHPEGSREAIRELTPGEARASEGLQESGQDRAQGQEELGNEGLLDAVRSSEERQVRERESEGERARDGNNPMEVANGSSGGKELFQVLPKKPGSISETAPMRVMPPHAPPSARRSAHSITPEASPPDNDQSTTIHVLPENQSLYLQETVSGSRQVANNVGNSMDMSHTRGIPQPPYAGRPAAARRLATAITSGPGRGFSGTEMDDEELVKAERRKDRHVSMQSQQSQSQHQHQGKQAVERGSSDDLARQENASEQVVVHNSVVNPNSGSNNQLPRSALRVHIPDQNKFPFLAPSPTAAQRASIASLPYGGVFLNSVQGGGWMQQRGGVRGGIGDTNLDTLLPKANGHLGTQIEASQHQNGSKLIPPESAEKGQVAAKDMETVSAARGEQGKGLSGSNHGSNVESKRDAKDGLDSDEPVSTDAHPTLDSRLEDRKKNDRTPESMLARTIDSGGHEGINAPPPTLSQVAVERSSAYPQLMASPGNAAAPPLPIMPLGFVHSHGISPPRTAALAVAGSPIDMPGLPTHASSMQPSSTSHMPPHIVPRPGVMLSGGNPSQAASPFMMASSHASSPPNPLFSMAGVPTAYGVLPIRHGGLPTVDPGFQFIGVGAMQRPPSLPGMQLAGMAQGSFSPQYPLMAVYSPQGSFSHLQYSYIVGVHPEEVEGFHSRLDMTGGALSRTGSSGSLDSNGDVFLNGGNGDLFGGIGGLPEGRLQAQGEVGMSTGIPLQGGDARAVVNNGEVGVPTAECSQEDFLSGDFDAHRVNLEFGRRCQTSKLNGSSGPSPLASLPIGAVSNSRAKDSRSGSNSSLGPSPLGLGSGPTLTATLNGGISSLNLGPPQSGPGAFSQRDRFQRSASMPGNGALSAAGSRNAYAEEMGWNIRGGPGGVYPGTGVFPTVNAAYGHMAGGFSDAASGYPLTGQFVGNLRQNQVHIQPQQAMYGHDRNGSRGGPQRGGGQHGYRSERERGDGSWQSARRGHPGRSQTQRYERNVQMNGGSDHFMARSGSDKGMERGVERVPERWHERSNLERMSERTTDVRVMDQRGPERGSDEERHHGEKGSVERRGEGGGERASGDNWKGEQRSGNGSERFLEQGVDRVAGWNHEKFYDARGMGRERDRGSDKHSEKQIFERGMDRPRDQSSRQENLKRGHNLDVVGGTVESSAGLPMMPASRRTSYEVSGEVPNSNIPPGIAPAEQPFDSSLRSRSGGLSNVDATEFERETTGESSGRSDRHTEGGFREPYRDQPQQSQRQGFREREEGFADIRKSKSLGRHDERPHVGLKGEEQQGQTEALGPLVLTSMEHSQPSPSEDHTRLNLQYQMKEEDFPPLSQGERR